MNFNGGYTKWEDSMKDLKIDECRLHFFIYLLIFFLSFFKNVLTPIFLIFRNGKLRIERERISTCNIYRIRRPERIFLRDWETVAEEIMEDPNNYKNKYTCIIIGYIFTD